MRRHLLPSPWFGPASQPHKAGAAPLVLAHIGAAFRLCSEPLRLDWKVPKRPRGAFNLATPRIRGSGRGHL